MDGNKEITLYTTRGCSFSVIRNISLLVRGRSDVTMVLGQALCLIVLVSSASLVEKLTVEFNWLLCSLSVVFIIIVNTKL